MPSLTRSLTLRKTLRSGVRELIRRFLPREPRMHSVWRGPLRGAQIFTSWHDYPGAILGTTERALLLWFETHVHPGETWLDVGAHYGYTAVALTRLVGCGGRVFAFEPVLKTAVSLERTRALNRLEQLTIVPVALSEAAVPETLQVPASRGMADGTLPNCGEIETIRAVALDAIWESLAGHGSPLHGIKIDVQGMELAALRGMCDSLSRYQPTVIVELHSGVDRSAVIETLAGCGYHRWAEPIEPDEDPTQPQYRDNDSYVFRSRRCASWSTPSPTARS
jgi:FkbM family methyltransferase